VADPLHLRAEQEPALELALAEATRFLSTLDEDAVRDPDADSVADALAGPLPTEGSGAVDALRELADATPAATRSAGPRFFHFVIGGSTPAALAADWLASALDQNAGMWTSSPLATQLESVAVDWLKELFELPADWSGVLTTGATMANVVGLASARRWYGEQHGVDVEKQGLAAVPPLRVFSSGYIHVSAEKALAMLGIGTENVRRLMRDEAGRLDVDALERELAAVGGPTIVIATAGEVNAGGFDPIAQMADLAERHGAWLHVDGAFGLFARVTPEAASLAAGLDRAHSAIADGHKWLNVPYECGFAFVRDGRYQTGAFAAGAPYLTGSGERTMWSFLGPEMSRRARAFATWATLRAYGRSGYRAMVERHLALARRVAEQVEATPELELLAPVDPT
jgi:glutamate/tyrosine decarboxylase-like PLP-dependent enzyme